MFEKLKLGLLLLFPFVGQLFCYGQNAPTVLVSCESDTDIEVEAFKILRSLKIPNCKTYEYSENRLFRRVTSLKRSNDETEVDIKLWQVITDKKWNAEAGEDSITENRKKRQIEYLQTDYVINIEKKGKSLFLDLYQDTTFLRKNILKNYTHINPERLELKYVENETSLKPYLKLYLRKLLYSHAVEDSTQRIQPCACPPRAEIIISDPIQFSSKNPDTIEIFRDTFFEVSGHKSSSLEDDTLTYHWKWTNIPPSSNYYYKGEPPLKINVVKQKIANLKHSGLLGLKLKVRNEFGSSEKTIFIEIQNVWKAHLKEEFSPSIEEEILSNNYTKYWSSSYSEVSCNIIEQETLIDRKKLYPVYFRYNEDGHPVTYNYCDRLDENIKIKNYTKEDSISTNGQPVSFSGISFSMIEISPLFSTKRRLLIAITRSKKPYQEHFQLYHTPEDSITLTIRNSVRSYLFFGIQYSQVMLDTANSTSSSHSFSNVFYPYIGINISKNLELSVAPCGFLIRHRILSLQHPQPQYYNRGIIQSSPRVQLRYNILNLSAKNRMFGLWNLKFYLQLEYTNYLVDYNKTNSISTFDIEPAVSLFLWENFEIQLGVITNSRRIYGGDWSHENGKIKAFRNNIERYVDGARPSERLYLRIGYRWAKIRKSSQSIF